MPSSPESALLLHPAGRRSAIYGEERSKPVISMFYGIIIRIFYFDTDKHKAPHIHVQYADESAVIGLPEGDILEGALKSSKMKLVQAWLEIHRDELMADCSSLSRGNLSSRSNH